MPTNLLLGLDGAAIVLEISGHRYVLTAPYSELSLPLDGDNSLPGRVGGHIKFVYDGSVESPMDIGTIADVLRDVQSLLPESDSPPFVEQWTTISGLLNQVPLLKEAGNIAMTTHVGIYYILIELFKDPDNDGYFSGSFVLGLTITPSTRPTLFRVQLVSIGAKLSITLAGPNDLLGFDW